MWKSLLYRKTTNIPQVRRPKSTNPLNFIYTKLSSSFQGKLFNTFSLFVATPQTVKPVPAQADPNTQKSPPICDDSTAN
jgi:hypothetical protein